MIAAVPNRLPIKHLHTDDQGVQQAGDYSQWTLVDDGLEFYRVSLIATNYVACLRVRSFAKFFRRPLLWRAAEGHTLLDKLLNCEQTNSMAFGTFIAHASFNRVRIASPLDGLSYAYALPAATQARPHWQAAIAAAQNVDETEMLLDKARDALKFALNADLLLIKWSNEFTHGLPARLAR